MNEGDTVTYTPFNGADKSKEQQGIVKTIDERGIFVVFNCGGNWEHYQDYTAQKCNRSQLRLNWD
jgi:hypothetical protein